MIYEPISDDASSVSPRVAYAAYLDALDVIAKKAVDGARAGKRVCVLVSDLRERRALGKAIHAALMLDERMEIGYLFTRHEAPKWVARFGEDGRVHVVTSPRALWGSLYDEIVECPSCFPELLQEARGRLVGAHQ